jgi:tetratricopeptide (TPR) repeat protein
MLFANRRWPLFSGVLLAVALSGCGHSGGAKPAAVKPEATAAAESAAAVASAPAALTPAVTAAYAEALAAMQAGDWQKAAPQLQALVDQNPDLPGPMVNLGLTLRRLNRAEDGQKLLESAAERWPDFAPAQHQLGLSLRDSGKFEAADAAFARALRVNPDYALAYYDRGVLNELYLQRLPEALDNYLQFQRLQPAEDEQVNRWITDLRRRTGAPAAAPAAATPTGNPS